MSPPLDFKQYYETELVPGLRELNARRGKIMWIALGCVGSGVSFVALVFAPISTMPGVIPLLFLTAVLTGVVWWWKWRNFHHAYKQEVMARVVKFLDPELRYLPADKIDREKFDAGRIFKQHIDSYEGEDCVWGTVGATTFEFSELEVEYKTSHDDEKAQWRTIFKGVYFVADFNKHFQSHTVVLPDSLQGKLGFIGQALQSLNPSRDDLIKLEDPEFEQEFVVYGHDQVEARYILTPALMQRMVELKRKIGGNVYFAFTGSEIHVAMATTKDRFEPRLFSSLLNYREYAAYLDDLRLIIGLVEDLNLNTRIWSKV